MMQRRHVFLYGFAAVAFLILPDMALAQATPVTAANGVEFTASADHSATDAFGQPLVGSYALDIVNQATSAIFVTVDLGKPTPGAANLITVDPVAAFGTLVPGTLYIARVRAVNANASSAPSGATSPFGIPAPLPAPAAPVALSVVP